MYGIIEYKYNKKKSVIMAEIGYGYGSEYQLMRFLGERFINKACLYKCKPIEIKR